MRVLCLALVCHVALSAIEPANTFGRKENGAVALSDAATDPEDYPTDRSVKLMKGVLQHMIAKHAAVTREIKEHTGMLSMLGVRLQKLIATVTAQKAAAPAAAAAAAAPATVAAAAPAAAPAAAAAAAAAAPPTAGCTAASLAAVQAAVKAAQASLAAKYGGGFGKMVELGTWSAAGAAADVEAVFARALRRGGKFVYGVMGGSLTAGHDVYFKDAWPFKMEQTLAPALAAGGLTLEVRNQAMGNTGTAPNDFCMAQMIGKDCDLAAWEYMMNDAGTQGNPKEVFLRNAWFPTTQPKQPPVMLVFADVPRDPRDAPPASIKAHSAPPPADFFAGAERWLDQPAALGAHYRGFGLHAMSVARAVWYHDHEAQFNFFHFNHADKPFRKEGLDAGWHAGPFGHTFRGDVVAAYYLQRLAKAAAALLPEAAKLPAGATLPPAPARAPRPLPAPRSCEKSLCGAAPAGCATAFQPQVSGELGDAMLNGTSLKGTWTYQVSPKDANAVKKSQARGLGYRDLKFVYRGDASTGWAVFQANGAKTGPILLCEPNMGWRRADDNAPLSSTADVEVKVDGKLVASFPRTSALLNSVTQDGAGGAVPLCTTVALTVAPGDHQIAVRVKSASKKHAVVSQLIWW